jgi:hypothetical protein
VTEPSESSAPDARPGAVKFGLQDRLEMWIYRLNEEQHWIFRLYDWGNEIWARWFFRGTRRRASEMDLTVTVNDVSARVRFLGPEDAPVFAEFMSQLKVKYLPPHELHAEEAVTALGRRSYLPIGIFVEGRMIGYILLRLFFFRRAVTGIWMLASTHSVGVGRHTLLQSVEFLKSERLPNYCTIPLGNEPSLRIAHWCGWRVIRTNRHFNVLKVTADSGEDLRK